MLCVVLWYNRDWKYIHVFPNNPFTILGNRDWKYIHVFPNNPFTILGNRDWKYIQNCICKNEVRYEI